MHRDPPPGIFEFARRSLSYTIGLGLLTGFLLSIFVYGAVLIWRADRGGSEIPKASASTIEAATMAVRDRTATTPAPTAALRYR